MDDVTMYRALITVNAIWDINSALMEDNATQRFQVSKIDEGVLNNLKALSVILNSNLNFFPNSPIFFAYSERTSLK